MLDQDGATIMLSVKPFTIISGGAVGVDLEAEMLARHYNLGVEVIIPPHAFITLQVSVYKTYLKKN